MTRALIPALRASDGRIVNIGLDRRAPGAPFVGALRGVEVRHARLLRSLRLELHGQGIHVALIEPGAIATEIWRKGDEAFAEVDAELPPELLERYRTGLDRRAQGGRAGRARGRSRREQVAGVVEHALTARRPKARYVVGADARVQALLARLPAGVPDRLLRLRSSAPERLRSMARVIGVDVGGTKVAVASLEDGVLGEVRTRPTEKESPDALVDQLVEAIEEHGDADAVGIGIPCVIDFAARHGDARR